MEEQKLLNYDIVILLYCKKVEKEQIEEFGNRAISSIVVP